MSDNETDTFQVVSFNIRYGTARDGMHSWPLRRRGVRELMRTLAYDVCGLQEVMNAQRDYLADALPDADWYGVGRADGFREGEQAPLVLRRTAIDVADWSTRWLAEDPDAVGSRGWDAKIPRVATVVRGRHVATGTDIGIINTHFDHRGAQAQHESARLLASIVRQGSSRCWVVMGDFNVGIDSPALAPFFDAGLRSAVPADAGGTFHGWSGATDHQRIDHIFISAGWTVARSGICHDRPWGILPSDHWPVFADLRMT